LTKNEFDYVKYPIIQRSLNLFIVFRLMHDSNRVVDCLPWMSTMLLLVVAEDATLPSHDSDIMEIATAILQPNSFAGVLIR